MAYQLAVIHQDKGKSRAVASPSAVQVLSKHPSTRTRKFTKSNVRTLGSSAASFSRPPRHSAATDAEQSAAST